MSYAKQFDILRKTYADNEKIFTGGNGAVLTDESGAEYIDLSEMEVILGYNNSNFNKKILEALHGPTSKKSNTNPYKERLYERLIETTNNDFNNIHLTSSGSEAVEWAIKTARKITGKSGIISFWNSIHGRTHLSAGVSGLPKRKAGYGPLDPSILYSPYPKCEKCMYNLKSGSCSFYCLDFLAEKIKYETAHDIAAVLVEPYQAAGIIIPPEGFLAALRKWTEEREILLIFDEIQSGMGRTGNMYFYQTQNAKPDMLLLGKGLGNGFHISALLSNKDLGIECLPALAGGSGDIPLSCAAACAVLDELLDNGLIENSKTVGAYILKRFAEFKSEFSSISNVRGIGLAVAMEFNSTDEFNKFNRLIKKSRLITVNVDSTVILKPPLCLTLEQADFAMDIFKKALLVL